ncbi:MAG: 3-hydroxybutyrate dehydrogenase [Pseudomonadota bacterium]
MSLKGKVAVITGSTSGIGLGVLTELAKAGAHVVMNDHTGDAAHNDAVAALAAEHGVQGAYIKGDLSKAEECVSLIEQAEATFGQVDIVVNNAGIQYVEKIEDFPPERWDLIISLNLNSSFHTTRAALRGMKTRGWGRFVNIASAHGLTASPFKSAYVAAKHGLVGFTKVTALEGADFGVTANAICPGYVWTPLVEGQLEEQMKAHGKDKDWVIENVMLDRQGMKKFATVEQMGATAVFLCSPGADTITGTSISVDGGWTAL